MKVILNVTTSQQLDLIVAVRLRREAAEENDDKKSAAKWRALETEIDEAIHRRP